MASPGFFNRNRNRAYPFILGTVNVGVSGPLTLRNLPNDVIVDAGFVTGTGSGYESATHSIYLHSIVRSGDTFYFNFESDAPQLYQATLTFTRSVDDNELLTEHSDSDAVYGISESDDVCTEPLWSGFLVTGDLSVLADLLPGDGTVERGSGGAILEPALVQNLAGTYVSSINLANDDRTRVTAPDGCDEVSWPFTPEPLYVRAMCLRGRVVLTSGYNTAIRQDDAENRIVISPAVGAGTGQPCDEVELFIGEANANGSVLKSGGLSCNEALRTFNGVGGRIANLLSGLGVQITPVPDDNKVIIDLNFSGLTTCADAVSEVSETV